MGQSGSGGPAARRVSVAFSRGLSTAVLGLVLLMAATLIATFWMARQQDIAAQSASRRMVAGGLSAFVERAKATLLDYAIWTDAYENVLAGNVEWISANIGDSDAFDLVVVQAPYGAPIGRATEMAPGRISKPEAISTANRLLDAVPVDSGSAQVAYVPSGGALWFLAVARVVSQSQLPTGAADADLPRLIIGFQMTPGLLQDIGHHFMIENLTLAPGPVSGEDVIVLNGVDGSPLGWVSWTPPTPGRAVLLATLWPLVGLMLVVTVIVGLVSSELLRSARRLEAALVQARAAEVTKSEFLGNVSHELRTPLNGIIGVAQLLQLREREPDALHMLDILLASAHSQLNLVNRLLDTTQIEAGTMALEQKPFNPATVLEETVSLIAPDIEKKQLALHVAIEPADR